MINHVAIAKHLRVKVNQIKSVDLWANCLFVVVKGLGARFVSKKIMPTTPNPYLAEAQRLIDTAKKSSGSGEDRVYKRICVDKAVKWGVEIILKLNCGVQEDLLKLLWKNIESGIKPEFRTFKKKIQDGLDEASFWASENAEWDTLPEVSEIENDSNEWEFQTKTGWQW